MEQRSESIWTLREQKQGQGSQYYYSISGVGRRAVSHPRLHGGYVLREEPVKRLKVLESVLDEKSFKEQRIRDRDGEKAWEMKSGKKRQSVSSSIISSEKSESFFHTNENAPGHGRPQVKLQHSTACSTKI